MIEHERVLTTPDKVVGWGNSEAKIFNFQDSLNAAYLDKVIVYDSRDFNTPIEHVSITIARTPLSYGEIGITFSGQIHLDSSREDIEPILNKIQWRLKEVPKPTTYPTQDGDLMIAPTVFHSVSLITDPSGLKVLTFVDKKNGQIIISNSLELSGPKNTIKVKPLPETSINQLQAFSAFVVCMMRSVGIASRSTVTFPYTYKDNYRQNRTYFIGPISEREIDEAATISQNEIDEAISQFRELY